MTAPLNRIELLIDAVQSLAERNCEHGLAQAMDEIAPDISAAIRLGAAAGVAAAVRTLLAEPEFTAAVLLAGPEFTAAVERAARRDYEDGLLHRRTPWEDASEGVRETHREHVRPVVRAAFGGEVGSEVVERAVP